MWSLFYQNPTQTQRQLLLFLHSFFNTWEPKVFPPLLRFAIHRIAGSEGTSQSNPINNSFQALSRPLRFSPTLWAVHMQFSRRAWLGPWRVRGRKQGGYFGLKICPGHVNTSSLQFRLFVCSCTSIFIASLVIRMRTETNPLLAN